MLAIALILFSWRGLVENKYWIDGILKLSFWGLNVGLYLMFVTGLLPIDDEEGGKQIRALLV